MEDTDVTVTAVETVGEEAIALVFGTPEGFDARPGQFVKLALPMEEAASDDREGDEATSDERDEATSDDRDAAATGGHAERDGTSTESRFYTISSPDVQDTFEITVEIDPDGAVGPHLAELEPGDSVVMSGPFGNAYYEDETRVLVLAGGPGVGPAIGIAERALDDGGEAAVVYRDDSPIHEHRLTELEERGADVWVLAPGQAMDDAVAGALTDDAQVFVYGFADFLDDATSAISGAGGEPDGAKVENFG